MTASNHYDLLVIGGGSGGVRASRMAAATGAKVGLCESFRYGGTCVIRGCVPKRLLSYAAHIGEDLHDVAGYGWSLNGKPSFDWKTLIANKDKEIDRLENVYENFVLKSAGVDMMRGFGKITGPGALEVDGKPFTADKILIAVGGAPTKLDLPGAELAITSNEIFHLEDFPKDILIYGAGYIAVEFAGIMNGLGANVTLAFRGDKMLRGFDEDLRDHLTEQMTAKGVTIAAGTTIEELSGQRGAIKAKLKGHQDLEVAEVLMATGRKPNIDGLGLETVGIETGKGGKILVDDYFATNVEGFYALGDVIDRIQLTPVALNEGMCFVDTHFKGKPRAMDYEDVASAVFSDPNLASVGLPEHVARERGYDVEIYRSTFRPMKYQLPDRQERGLMKLVVDKASDKVLGLHIAGPDAGEVVQGFAVAVKMGATKADFDATVGIHPTAAEELVTMRTPVAD